MTRLNMIDRRKALGILLAGALVVTTALVAALPRQASAAVSEGITGQFTLGNEAPVLTEAATLYDDGHSAPVTQMTPQTPYEVKVSVADTGTIDDLDTVVVTIFYDADSDDDTADVPVAGDTQTCFIMTCTVGGASGTWTHDPAASTSWDVNDTDCVQPSLSAGSGDFYFNFTPGMVATEAGDWDVYIEVTDDAAQTDTYYDTATGDYDMLWYGAIDVTTAGPVNWETVTAGMDFDNAAAKEQVAATCISNGAYDTSVQSAATWSTTGVLSADDSPGANEFALKAYSSDTLGSAILVTDDEADCIISTDGTQTDEDGVDNTANTLYLKLGTPFVDGTYSGTITFFIRNGS